MVVVCSAGKMEGAGRQGRALEAGRMLWLGLVLLLPVMAWGQLEKKETTSRPGGGEGKAVEKKLPGNSGQPQGGAGNSDGTRMIIEMKTGETHLEQTQSPQQGRFSQWIDLQILSTSFRYHFIQDSAGVTTNNLGQYLGALKGALRLDSSGRYTIQAGILTGNRFVSGWNASGWGTGPSTTNFNVKQLFADARPIRGVELQYGGLYFNQGETTEITGYDNDGYLMGERIRLMRPKNFYFDEISITYGFVGDLNRPSVGQRFRRLAESNYHQFLLGKKLGERVSVSGDYTFQSGVDTLRQAVRIHVRELRLIDVFQFENYQVVAPDSGYGFSVYGQKKLRPNLSLGAGYAQHDRPGLYSDRFAQGKRVFVNVQKEMSSGFSVSMAITQAIENAQATGTRTRVDLALNYNLLPLVRKTGLF